MRSGPAKLKRLAIFIGNGVLIQLHRLAASCNGSFRGLTESGVGDFTLGFGKFADRVAHAAGEGGQILPAKEKEGNEQDDEDIRSGQIEESGNGHRGGWGLFIAASVPEGAGCGVHGVSGEKAIC